MGAIHAACTPCSRALQGLLEILSSASEFDELPIRPGEEEAVRKLLMHAPVAVESPRYTDPHIKANALLQAHFSRVHLGGDLATDQAEVVSTANRLLQARPPSPCCSLQAGRLSVSACPHIAAHIRSLLPLLGLIPQLVDFRVAIEALQLLMQLSEDIFSLEGF